MTDALSKVANQNPARKIWATKFAGVTLGTPTRNGSARDWNTSIDGTDALTGHGFTVDSDLQAFFGPTAEFRLQQINSSSQPIPTDLTEFNANFTNSISTSTDLISTPGAGHLSLRNLICTSADPSQSILMCERSAPSSVNYDQTEFYYTGVYQFPVGMNLNASGKYKVFFEVKGGALKQSLVDAVVNGSVRDGSSCAATDGVANAGKFRIALMINGFFGTNAIQVKLDNVANNGGLTIPNAYFDETGYQVAVGSSYNYFSTDSTSVLPSGIPLGVPLRFHVHYKRPPTPLYADRHKGIFKVSVENLATSEWLDLCSIQNSSAYQLSSTFNEPWSRIFPTSYDSMDDVELKMTDLQFWDKPPIKF